MNSSKERAMLNEGLLVNTTTAVMKTQMLRSLAELGPTTPDDWERAVFKAVTGHDREEVDWGSEDNQAGYFTWIKSFDNLVEELAEDGFVQVEDLGGGQRRLSPVETDPDLDWAKLVHERKG
jgi:hypothetical protein